MQQHVIRGSACTWIQLGSAGIAGQGPCLWLVREATAAPCRLDPLTRLQPESLAAMIAGVSLMRGHFGWALRCVQALRELSCLVHCCCTCVLHGSRRLWLRTGDIAQVPQACWVMPPACNRRP